MEQLQLLAVALGLAGLAGINLYLTVFVTGLAINQHWIILAPQYQDLQVLGHPAIIALAGALYFLEFFADKIPWVDSLWDSVHTVIRPIGAAMLAIQVLGDSNQVYAVIVALLAGGTALMTHTIKASTRLVVNSSPEPFSNVALSVGEDVGVLGGLALVSYNPILALAALAVLLSVAIYFLPKLFRMAKLQLWLVYHKLRAPAGNGPEPEELPHDLPSDLDVLFSHLTVLEEKPLWAVPCASGGGRSMPSNVFGYLVASHEEPGKLYFVGKTAFSSVAESLEIAGYRAAREGKFLSENLVIYNPEKKRAKYVFVFDRTAVGRVKQLVEVIRERLSHAAAAREPVEAAEPERVEAA